MMLREPLQRALRISDFFVSMSLKRQKLLLATVVYDNIPLFLPADKIRERLDKILYNLRHHVSQVMYVYKMFYRTTSFSSV